MNFKLLKKQLDQSNQTIKALTKSAFLVLFLVLLGSINTVAQDMVLTVTNSTITDPVPTNFDVTVEIQAGAVPIDGVNPSLEFDPAVLQVVSAAAVAPFFQLVPATIDNTNGTISYNVGLFSGFPTGTFDAATITFQAIATGNTSITFSNSPASIVSSGGGNVLQNTTGVSLTIGAANTAPSVSISAPTNGATVTRGTNIALTGTATDTEDGDISTNLAWTSDDIQFSTTPLSGIGASITGQMVTPGAKIITASVTDSDGAPGSAQVSVNVSGPEVDITAPAEGGTVASTNVQIQWTPTAVITGLLEHFHLFVNPPDLNNIDTETRISTASAIGQNFWDLTAADGIVPGANTVVIRVANQFHEEFSNPEAQDIVNFTVTIPNSAPTVSITAPLDGATFVEGDDVTVNVNATDDVAVTQVELFDGITSLGVDATAPYSFDLTNIAQGTYNLTAVASDASTTTTSAVVTITVGPVNVAPTVSITSPLDGEDYVIGSNLTVEATAADSDGSVVSIEFFDGITSLGTDVTAPFEADITGLTAGSHALTAVATDDDGAQTTSAIVTINGVVGEADVVLTPSASVVNGIGTTFTVLVEIQPVNGQPVDGATLNISYDPALIEVSNYSTPNNPFNIPINAPSNSGGIINYSGGSTVPFPSTNFEVFTIEFTTISVGTANIGFTGTNIVTSNGADITRNTVGTSVIVNTPPTVTITAPLDGATFTAGDDVLIAATAADADGNITQVEFFDGITSLGTDNTAPYEFTIVGITAGTYALTAVATDDNGESATSTVVNITASIAATLPVITVGGPGVKTVNEAGTLQVPVSISDLDGDNLTVTISSVSNEPQLLQTTPGPVQADPFPINADGFLSINNVNNVPGSYSADFDFAPIYGDGGGADGDGSGVYTITIEVTDGTNTVTETFDVEVIDIHQPVAASGSTRIEAESFDNQGPANTIPGNTSDTKGIGVEINDPGVTNIGFTSDGDFAEYLIDVAQAGTYLITFQVAKNSGSAATMTINGGPAAITVSPTGGWQSYIDATAAVTLAAGQQTLRFDWSGASFLFNIDYFDIEPASPPTVSITAPADGASFQEGDDVTVTVDATDDVAVTQVELFNGVTSLGVDLTAPYSFDILGITPGTYVLTAVASDANTSTTSTVVTITVNAAPTVSITAPVDGAVFTEGDDVLIEATAADTDGTITQVEFFDGATSLGVDNTAPYEFTITGITAGSYALTAVATDDATATTTSSVVNITVNPPGIFELCIASGSGPLTAYGRSFEGDSQSTGAGAHPTRTNGKVFGGTPTIVGTTPGSGEELLFQKEVYGGAGGTNPSYSYDIPVTNGLFEVTLYFAEAFPNANLVGERIFDVMLEGNLILDEWDMLNTLKDGPGAQFTPNIRTYYVDVTDGLLNVMVGPATVDNGKLSGLCVKEVASANLTPTMSLPNLTAEAGVAATLPFDANITDPDNTTFNVVLNNLPASLTYNPTTGQIEGTPTQGEAGTVIIFAIVDDGTSSPIVGSFELEITGDDPPTIDPVADQALIAGGTLTVNVTVTDDNTPSATIQIFDKSVIPGGAQNQKNKNPFESGSIVNPGDYTFTAPVNPGEYVLDWTTTPADGRAYWARVTADDGVNPVVIEEFPINVAQAIPGTILAKTFANPLPWYGPNPNGSLGRNLAIETNAAQNIGYIDNNDLVDYWINVPEAGTYDVRIAAAKGTGGTTNVTMYEDDGAGGFTNYPAGPGLGSVGVTNQGGWQSYNDYYTQITFVNAGLQQIRLGFNGGANILEFEFLEPTAYVKTKVALQGPFEVPDPITAPELMHDELRQTLDVNDDRVIPLTDPYGLNQTIPLSYLDDNVANPENTIVDWVKLELRDATDPTIIVAETVGLVQRDGDVIGIDGTDTILFTSTALAPAGLYHLAIVHRNHIAVMTDAALIPTNPAGTVTN